MGLPIESHLVDSDGQRLRDDAYYVPGSVLEVAADTTRPVAFGLAARTNVLFDNSPVLRTTADVSGLIPVARFDSDRPLRSGWAWGQNHLEGGIAALEASVGSGTVYLFGPEIVYRGQPHGTFKLLFNSLHLARVEPVHLGDGSATRR